MSTSKLTEAQRKRIEDALSTVPFAKLLGIKLDSVEPGDASLSLQIRDDFRQNAGVVHGGVIASLIDSATAFAILPLLNPNERSTTVDLTISYLRPLTVGSMVAHAKVIRAGQRLIVVFAELHDDAGNLAATALSTYMRLSKKRM
ncbi:MAG TPA: PaaI family thioesterase [Pyrinomonadaceae bacterium]|nr:PaaI family thioesterase [Pyrinomonadaceae bacterium]